MSKFRRVAWRRLPVTVSRATALGLLYGSVAIGLGIGVICAQTPPAAQPPAPPPSPQGTPPPAPQPALLTAEQLDKLLAPIALYPDALLAQMMPASAYPLDIVRAQRWIERNRPAVEKRDFSDADQQNWDVSVKSMVRFPEVVKKMSDDLDWTTDIGEAFVAQPRDVSESIQRLRKQAEQSGTLKSTPEQRVVVNDNTIVIQPAKPDTIYVPQYNPTTVYTTPSGTATGALIGFSAGVLLATAINNNNSPYDWRRGYVYPPVWIPPAAYPPGYYPRPPGTVPPGYYPPGYRPGGNPPGSNPPGYSPPGYRPPPMQPWRPDPDRYRPTPRTPVTHTPGAPATTPGQGPRPGAPTTTPGQGPRPGAPATTPGQGPRPGAPATAPAQGPRPGVQSPAAKPPDVVAPRPTPQTRPGQPAQGGSPTRPAGTPQRTVFDGAGDTGRTDAFKQRGASSRGGAGPGGQGAGGPRGGGGGQRGR